MGFTIDILCEFLGLGCVSWNFAEMVFWMGFWVRGVSNLRGFGFSVGRCLFTSGVGRFDVLFIVDCGYLSCLFVGCFE